MKRLTLLALLTLSLFGTAQAHLRWGVKYQGYGPYKIWGNPEVGYVVSYVGGSSTGQAEPTRTPASGSTFPVKAGHRAWWLMGSPTDSLNKAGLLARANHTGTQLYSTISDPPSIPAQWDSASVAANSWAIRGNAVPADPPTNGYLFNSGFGLSWATPAGGGGGPASCKKTADQTNNTVTYADCSGLSFAVTSGTYYHFRFNLIFRTAATTTGIKFKLTGPTVTTFACEANVPFAADGAGGAWQGHISAYADSAKTTGVQIANTDFFAVVEGSILPSAGGTLQLQFASEVAASNTIIRQGSNGLLYTIP